ncbi:MAG: mandelate racemase/muconate lactonizing protein [Chloroflexota bacterium]|nr:mandelate racemase/muconate lactonizing protein [Chloroflexota bacterium]
MKIDRVRAFQLTGPADLPQIEERTSRPLDVYPQVARQEGGPRPPGAPLTQTYIEIGTDEGATGLFGPLFEETAVIILRKLKPYLLGLDPLAGELVWDVLYRQDRHARTGYEMMAISAVDCALWDLRGTVAGQPIYRLLGGPTRDRVDCYASMLGHSHEPDRVRERATWAVEQGYTAQKWFFRYGPVDGLAGLRKNVELVRTVREAVGPDVEILLDCGRGWTATYAIRLLERIDEFQPRWLEEPVQPDRLVDYVQIRRSTNIPIAHGEHEYTRWGFLQLLQADCVDVVQADPDWCGGISELVKICTLASAFGRPVIPHGHSINAAVHVIAALSPETCPMAEFLIKSQPMKQWFHKRIVEPENGAIPLPTAPGLGIEIDEAKVERRTELG